MCSKGCWDCMLKVAASAGKNVFCILQQENTTLSSPLVCVQSTSALWGVVKQVQEGCRMIQDESTTKSKLPPSHNSSKNQGSTEALGTWGQKDVWSEPMHLH